MTVADLITRLQTLPSDRLIASRDRDGNLAWDVRVVTFAGALCVEGAP